jgi:hypothetical protein
MYRAQKRLSLIKQISLNVVLIWTGSLYETHQSPKKLARDKRSSLFCLSVIDEEKTVDGTGTRIWFSHGCTGSGSGWSQFSKGFIQAHFGGVSFEHSLVQFYHHFVIGRYTWKIWTDGISLVSFCVFTYVENTSPDAS